MSDPGLDQLYREVILDHYKNPRGHGVIEDADAEAEGQNPLCGDEVSIYVAFGEDGDTIDDVKFSGRGCAISPGRDVDADGDGEGPNGRARSPRSTKDELLEEIGDPAHPGAAQVRDARPRRRSRSRSTRRRGRRSPTASPASTSSTSSRRMPEITVAAADEFPPGSSKIVRRGQPLRRRLQLRRRAVRDRGPLLPRRRPALRGRLGRGALPGHLPAARLRVRSRDGNAALAPGDRAGRDVSGAHRRRHDRARAALTASEAAI